MKLFLALLIVFSPLLMAQVRVGAVYSTSGPQAALDVPSWNGARLAAEEINRKGGVQGKKLELVLLPVDSTSKNATAAVEKALKEDPSYSAFIGLSDSDLALPAARAASEAGKVFLTSGATSPRLPKQAGRRVFLAAFGDNAQAAAAAEWLIGEKQVRTAAILFNQSQTYTRLLNLYFSKTFRHFGGRITRSIGYVPDQPLLIPPAVLKADAIYLAAETAPEAQGIIRRLRGMGFAGPIVGGDGYDDPARWARNPLAENVFFTSHAFPATSPGAAGRAKARAFSAAYKKANAGHSPDSFSALGYDAVMLIARALDTAGNRSLRDALRGGKPYPGLTGSIEYTHGSRVPQKPVAVFDGTSAENARWEFFPAWVPTP